MNTGLQALGVEYVQKINQLNASLQQDMKTAASGEERAALVQEYQTRIRDLQLQAQFETRAIRQRYQST